MKFIGFFTFALLFSATFAKGQEVKVKPTQHNLGEVSKATTVDYWLYNEGTTPVVITDIESHCGCAKVRYSKRPIELGDSTKVTIVYTPRRSEKGLFYKTVTIHTTATKPLKLILRGTNK